MHSLEVIRAMNDKAVEAPKQRVWTYRSAPFRLGGTHEVMATDLGRPVEDVTVEGHHLLAYQNPLTKMYHVVDAESGGLVGIGESSSIALAHVIADIGQGDPAVIRKQVENAKRQGQNPDVLVEPDEFWRCFK